MRLSYTGTCFVEDESKRQKQKINIYERTKKRSRLFDKNQIFVDKIMSSLDFFYRISENFI
jgi:hypothetical protein